jgi:hypothetical protein
MAFTREPYLTDFKGPICLQHNRPQLKSMKSKPQQDMDYVVQVIDKNLNTGWEKKVHCCFHIPHSDTKMNKNTKWMIQPTIFKLNYLNCLIETENLHYLGISNSPSRET